MRLEQWSAEEGMSAQDATTRSTEWLALTQVVMDNSITSLRAVGRMEWRGAIEPSPNHPATLLRKFSSLTVRPHIPTSLPDLA